MPAFASSNAVLASLRNWDCHATPKSVPVKPVYCSKVERRHLGIALCFAFLRWCSHGAPPFENLLLESARTSGKIRLSSNLLYLSGGNAEFLRRAAVSLTHDA